MNLEDLDIKMIPQNRAEFEKITAEMRQGPVHQTSEFQSVSRSDRFISDAYLNKVAGADAKYNPRFSVVESKVARQITINAAKKGEPRTPIKIPPSCVADSHPCTLDKRMQITQMKRQND